MRQTFRLLAGAALVGVWLYLFLLGRTAGGTIHLLLVAALAILPWRSRAERTEPPR